MAWGGMCGRVGACMAGGHAWQKAGEIATAADGKYILVSLEVSLLTSVPRIDF